MVNKDEEAYKSISEVAEILNLINPKNGELSTHTLRYWEKEFKQIKPRIFSGKRRYYDNKSIQMLKKIKFLLKDHGMTIDGVKKHLDNAGQLKLDEVKNATINVRDENLKNKLTKISKLIKEIKKLS